MLVIGVGHPLRGDDAVGPEAAERLQAKGLDALVLDGEGARLIDAWTGRDHVVVIDALSTEDPVGTIRVIEAADEIVPTGAFRYSSHAFGLAEAIETSRALDQLPARLTIFGIAGRDFTLGAPMHPAVEAAMAEVITRVQRLAED